MIGILVGHLYIYNFYFLYFLGKLKKNTKPLYSRSGTVYSSG